MPYATNHRNSSFFLKTRLGYKPEKNWFDAISELKKDWDVTDIHIIRDEKCSQKSWKVYVMARDKSTGTVKRRIFIAPIGDWCVWSFENIFTHTFTSTISWCWDWKFLVTDYVQWDSISMADSLDYSSENETWWATWIQVNKIEWGRTVWMFRDVDTVNRYAKWKSNLIWKYLLVYSSKNSGTSWFAWQVRLVTDISADGQDLILDTPWLWFKVPEKWDEVAWDGLKYSFYSDWWEVVGFTDGRQIKLTVWDDENTTITPYVHEWTGYATNTDIIWVASANDKIFILTDNGYIHYSSAGYWYNKFFIDDDMFAGVDKIAITAYRDMIIAFGRKNISLWVPDEQNNYWTMYNQSTSIWLWSRYSFNEYDGDLIFVSNDKRLMALTVNSAGRYWLSFEDVWQMVNGKLSTLVEWDEAFVWSDNNNLRIFVNSKNTPFAIEDNLVKLNDVNNTLTHIYKFDTLFKVWTEDYIPHFCLRWAKHWIYFWQYGLYVKQRSTETTSAVDAAANYWGSSSDYQAVKTQISAYLIENENNWLNWRPGLFSLAKLNRLITTLGPGVYSNNSNIKITAYSKWIGYTYEFPISGDWNNRLWLITSYYLDEDLSDEDKENIECMLTTLQDSQKQYQSSCDSDIKRQYYRTTQPWCYKSEELITESHGVCIDDKLYELAPTMPLVTSLGENQQYATQIKLELIWWEWDIICFWWWLAEMYIAPLFLTWPDWEYQLQPNTEC